MDDRQDITFQKLTPIDNADISVYEDAIEFSLKMMTLQMLLFLVLTVQEKAVLLRHTRKNILIKNLYIFH